MAVEKHKVIKTLPVEPYGKLGYPKEYGDMDAGVKAVLQKIKSSKVKPMIIAVVGQPGAGKTEFCERLRVLGAKENLVIGSVQNPLGIPSLKNLDAILISCISNIEVADSVDGKTKKRVPSQIEQNYGRKPDFKVALEVDSALTIAEISNQRYYEFKPDYWIKTNLSLYMDELIPVYPDFIIRNIWVN